MAARASVLTRPLMSARQCSHDARGVDTSAAAARVSFTAHTGGTAGDDHAPPTSPRRVSARLPLLLATPAPSSAAPRDRASTCASTGAGAAMSDNQQQSTRTDTHGLRARL
jgi:hypothetical protein